MGKGFAMELYDLRRMALYLLPLVMVGCSLLTGPGVPSFKGESGNVNSIELAWADGSGMGGFVDSTADTAAARTGGAPLKYRVRVVFDTGFTTTLVQDGSVPLAVGDRVWIVDGKVLPHQSPETDPKRNLAPF
jgi:hypothetical protein